MGLLTKGHFFLHPVSVLYIILYVKYLTALAFMAAAAGEGGLEHEPKAIQVICATYNVQFV